ncbi:hypothetical protein V1525DRAFT_356763 [Lipomyces kononenkoae]|uniref:Uncharacterized protein n=1 Tax=Lipomyces kononenkoae TaxID=34357 RepID=A0ACC3T5X4_LIPKO
MAKKKGKDSASKKALKAEKALKAQTKSAVKAKKKASKLGDDDLDDVDIDHILEEYAREQANFVAVKITPTSRPSKRLNATLIPSPAHHSRRELFLFGGEAVNAAGLSEFYNDLFVYTVDTNIWRKVTSPNTPLPRSGHAMCVHPMTGVILLFGGEFSSPKQNTFYHYGDTWLLDATTREWTKLDVKKGPSARSGHRMTYWKNYILLHGGFRDLSQSTTYQGDLWAFDVTTYKWQQIEFPANALKPEPRSGHSFLPTEEGAVVWGGYSKVKNSQKKIVGKVHSDSWTLKLTSDLKTVRWERRRKSGWAPSSRVGCSMMFHKGRGILFGGVYDTEETDETLDSVFYNEVYAYQIASNKWFPLKLRPPRKKPVQQEKITVKSKTNELEENLSRLRGVTESEDARDTKSDEDSNSEASDEEASDEEAVTKVELPVSLSLPHPRFNSATAVLGDWFYIYGGVWEHGDREFTLDSMYTIDLSKLDGVRVIWEDFTEDLAKADQREESDEDMDEDMDDDEDEDEDEDGEYEDMNEEEEEEHKEDAPDEVLVDETDELADVAVGLDIAADPRPYLPHPRPFESLRVFYSRTGNVFMEWAISNNKDGSKRTKELKRDAFELCEGRWWERWEEVRAQEDQLEELGGIGEIVEREAKTAKSRR